MTPAFPSELKYASVLVYDKNQPQSKDFILNVKRDATGRFKYDAEVKLEKYRDVAVKSVAHAIQQAPWLHAYLNNNTCLVPAPGSGVFLEGALWATDRLCRSLVDAGLGASVEPIVKRVIKVQKSAYCKPGEKRPDPIDHYNSISVEGKLLPMNSITIVDDVITRGATTLGIYQKVKEAYPQVEIRLFALARTATHVGGFFSPHEGTISFFLNSIQRD